MASGIAAELQVLFSADTSALEKGLARAQKDIKDTGDAANKGGGMIGGLIGGLGKLGLAGLGIGAIKGAVSGVVGSFGDLIGAAESSGDALARVTGVLGESWGDAIKDQAAEAANSLGMTKTAYIDATGAAANYLVNLGLGKDAAGDMASQMTELAPKLAAFANMDPSAVTDALQKGVGGSTRGLKELGIAINDDLLKGLDDASKSAEIFRQIQEQSGPASAAWADNQGDVANSMARVSAAMDDAKAAIGERLLPIIAPLVQWFADRLPAAIDIVIEAGSNFIANVQAVWDKLVSFFSDTQGKGESFRDKLVGVWTTIKTAVGQVVDWFNANVKPILLAVFDTVVSKLATFKQQFDDKFGGIRGAVASVIEWFQTNVAPTIAVVFDRVMAVIGPVVAFLAAHMDEIKAIVGGAIDFAVGVFRVGFNLLKGIVETVMAVIRGDWSGAWDAIKATAANVVPGIKQALGGLWEYLKGLGKIALDAVIGVGTAIVDGIKKGIQDKWDAVTGWVGAQINKIPAGIRKLLGIQSPSKVMTLIGEQIVAGLRIGLEGIAIIGAIIQDGLAKAIGAMDVENFEMIHRLTTAILGIFKDAADGIRSLLEFDIVTSADEIGAAFDRLIGVFQTAIGKMAELSKFAGRGTQPGQDGFINMDHIANIERYTGAIEATLSVASGTLDILDKLAKVAMPGAGAITALIPFLQEIANAAAVFEQPLGKDEDAIAVFERGAVVAGHIATFAKNVADLAALKFGQISATFAAEVNAAAAAAGQAWAAVETAAGLWGDMESMLRDKLITGVKAYAEVVGAAVSILKGTGELDFTDAVFATAAQMKAAADVSVTAVTELGRIADWWIRAGAEVTGPIVDGIKAYGEAVGAAVGMLQAAGNLALDKMIAATAGQLHTAADVAAMALGELLRVIGQFADMAAEARTALVTAVKDYADAAGAAIGMLSAAAGLDFTKAVAVTREQLQTAADAAAMALGELMRVAGAFVAMGAEAAGPLVAGVKAFADGAGAAIDLLVKGAGGINALGEIKSLAGVQPGLIRAVLGNLKLALDTVLKNLPTFKPEQLARMKDMGDMAGVFDPLAKAATGINALGAIKSLAGVQPRMIRAILGGVNLAVKEVSAGAGTFEDGAVAKVKAWGEASAATLGALTTAADGLTKLGGKITIPEDLSARVAMLVSAMRTVVQGMAAALSGDGAISVDVAKAGADVAEAVGRIGEAFAPIFDAINAALASPFGRIKAKGQRGDTFRQNVADRIKASLVAAVTALSEALASMPAIEVPDTLLTGVERLATVYDRILDILGKLDGIKIDAKALAALAAVPGILAGGLTGMNVQGSGGALTMSGGASGGGITINNTVTPTFMPMPTTINNTITSPITVGPRVVQAIAVEVVNQFDTEIKLKPSGP